MCQAVWCDDVKVCMPAGCCQSSDYCGTAQLCQVNRPGGLCQDGPCCGAPWGVFTCRQVCAPGSPASTCPDAAPNCEAIQVGTEDYVESYYVCLP